MVQNKQEWIVKALIFIVILGVGSSIFSNPADATAVLSGGIITVNGTNNNLQNIQSDVNNATAFNCDRTNTGAQPEGIGFNCTMRASLVINGSMDMSGAWLYVNGTASQFYIDIIAGGGNFGNLSIRNFSHITSNTTQNSDFYVRNGARLDANNSNFSYIAGSTTNGIDIADTAGRVTIRHSFFNNSNSIQLSSAQYVLIQNTSFSGTAGQITLTSSNYTNITNVTIDAISSAIGISMTTKTNHTYIKGLNITNTPGTGINANNAGGTNNTFEDVTISGQNGAAQFSISDAGDNSIVLNSRITCGNGDICIRETGANLNVTNTQILSIPTAVGLEITGAGANVSKNRFTQTGSVVAAVNISASNGLYNNNTMHGIFRGLRIWSGTNNNFSYNALYNTGLCGYCIDGSLNPTFRAENETITAASGAVDTFYANRGSGIILRNWTLTGQGSANSAGMRIQPSTLGNHTFENITVDNFNLGIYAANVSDIKIRWSNISRATNVSIEAALASNNWAVENTNITAEGNLGFRVGDNTTNFNFTNITIDIAGNTTLFTGQGVNFTLGRVRAGTYPVFVNNTVSINRYFNATNLSTVITWLNISTYYLASDIPTGLTENSMTYWRNLTTNSTGWELQSSSIINTVAKTIQMNISSYSIWTLGGVTSAVVSTPSGSSSGCTVAPISSQPSPLCVWNTTSCSYVCPTENITTTTAAPLSIPTITNETIKAPSIFTPILYALSWGIGWGPDYSVIQRCATGICLNYPTAGKIPFFIIIIMVAFGGIVFIISKMERKSTLKAAGAAVLIAIIIFVLAQVIRLPVT